MLDLSKFVLILNIQDDFRQHYSLFMLFYFRSKISLLLPFLGLIFCWPLLFCTLTLVWFGFFFFFSTLLLLAFCMTLYKVHIFFVLYF